VYKNDREVRNFRDGVVTEVLDDGRTRQSVEFRTEITMRGRKEGSPGIPVQLSKVYSLTEGDYHLGLDVKLLRRKTGGAADRQTLKFRYQLTGAHGLPIEGKWYTSIFRNVLVIQVGDNGSVDRS